LEHDLFGKLLHVLRERGPSGPDHALVLVWILICVDTLQLLRRVWHAKADFISRGENHLKAKRRRDDFSLFAFRNRPLIDALVLTSIPSRQIR
jgi:hypothetical protein